MPKRSRVKTHFSPLRYPGGKGRLSGFVQKILEENKLLDGHYAEPYAGGAAVALSLLFLEFASHIHINDISKPVYYFWKATLDETDALCKLIRDTNVTADEWKRQHEILHRPKCYSPLRLGFAMFFLNRTNRSGIVHTGGMIGGKNQSGAWKLDARYNKEDLIRRVEEIANYRNRIRVSNDDAEKFLSEKVPAMPPKTLVYLDPPYFKQGGSLYENHYLPADHLRLSGVVKKEIPGHWMISYDNHPEIRKAYKGCADLVYSLSYSAARRYEGSEVMFFSRGLVVPTVTSPLDVD